MWMNFVQAADRAKFATDAAAELRGIALRDCEKTDHPDTLYANRPIYQSLYGR